ncbi:DUF397 domain-containing protein [Streptomyces sp. A5-4]|uniref:DUF397 domain-containing protein n=1 Tax=Streptomyces sp. A5-4 TaxID=3384771 RepID=UPI003DA807A3
MISSRRIILDSSNLTGWYKSTHSGGDSPQGECLETARGYDNVPVRDSKNESGPAVVFPPEVWSSFVSGIKGDVFPG